MPISKYLISHSGFENENDCCIQCGKDATHTQKGKMLCLDCFWEMRAETHPLAEEEPTNGLAR